MEKIKKTGMIVAVLALVIALSAFAVACGDGDTDTTLTPGTTEGDEITTTTMTDETTTSDTNGGPADATSTTVAGMTSTTETPEDIYDALNQDHEAVSPLLDQMADGDASPLDQVTEALTAHIQAEEATFYAALESNQAASASVELAKQEHQAAAGLLEQMAAARNDQTRFQDLATQLKTALDAHIEKEEGPIFDTAREILSEQQAEELGMQFVEQQQEALGGAGDTTTSST